jgi:hypothetical protein
MLSIETRTALKGVAECQAMEMNKNCARAKTEGKTEMK